MNIELNRIIAYLASKIEMLCIIAYLASKIEMLCIIVNKIARLLFPV